MFEYFLFGYLTVVVSLQLFSESTLFVESTVESPFLPQHYRNAITKHNASCFLSNFLVYNIASTIPGNWHSPDLKTM